MVEISHEEFETLVDEALAAIPDPVADRITNLAFLISDYAEESPYILGQYHGVALTERTFDHTGFFTRYHHDLSRSPQGFLQLPRRTGRASTCNGYARDRPLFWAR
ncbi:hypothetical protein CIP107537_02226 [Corynebacterium diphtheriae]|nr:hypothetical protein CIP107537_02226 [Corynebacterium diphtheriae]